MQAHIPHFACSIFAKTLLERIIKGGAFLEPYKLFSRAFPGREPVRSHRGSAPPAPFLGIAG
jgi:hypothetical protein